MAQSWTELLIRSLSIILVVVQAGLLDWYLVYYGGKAALGWIISDIWVLIAFVASYIYADSYFKQSPTIDEETPPQPPPTTDKSTRKKKKLATDPDTNNRNNKTDPIVKPKNFQPMLAVHDEDIVSLDENLQKDAKVQDSKEEDKTEEEDVDENSEWDKFEGYQDLKTKELEAEILEHERLKHLRVGTIRTKYNLGALPLSYISWALYSTILASKMLVIFLTFGDDLDANLLFGSNMLELAFVSTAAIFGLVVASHRKVPKSQVNQRNVISYMQNQVLMDIIDSVELLEFLYEDEPQPEKHPKMELHVRNAILAFVVIQLVIPTLSFYQLSATNFADQDPKLFWSMLQQFCNVFGENIPFLVIRIHMWKNNQHTESTFIFITKNVMEICTNQWEFVGWGRAQVMKCFGKTKSRKAKNRAQNIKVV